MDYFSALVAKFKDWFNRFMASLVDSVTPVKPPVEPPTKPIEPTIPVPPTPTPSPTVNETPWGFDERGRPMPGPAYFGMRRLWEAVGTKEGFNVYDFVPGIESSQDTPRVPPLAGKMQTLENSILALGASKSGREWLSKDENATLIDAKYQRLFNGYVVRRKSNNPDDGFVHVS